LGGGGGTKIVDINMIVSFFDVRLLAVDSPNIYYF
jgi:hypothetical protein